MDPVVVISFYKKTYGIKSVSEVAIFVSKSFSKRSFLDFDSKRYSSMPLLKNAFIASSVRHAEYRVNLDPK